MPNGIKSISLYLALLTCFRSFANKPQSQAHMRYTLALGVLLVLISSCTPATFTYKSGGWNSASSWTPPGGCSSNCFPGGSTSRTDDLALISTGSPTINTKSDIATGSFEIETSASLTLKTSNTGSFTISKVTVTGGDVKIDSSGGTQQPLVAEFNLGGKLDFQSNNLLTVTNLLRFQGSASLAGTGTLNLPDTNPSTVSVNLSVPSGLTLDSGHIQVNSGTLTNDGTFNNVRVTVQSGATFTHTNSFTSGTGYPFAVSGTLNIRDDMQSSSGFTSNTGSLVNIESGSEAIDVDFASYTFKGETVIKCQANANPIKLINNILEMNKLTVSGTSQCTVTLSVQPDLEVTQPITLTDSDLIINNNIKIGNTLRIDGDGQLTSGATIKLSTASSVLDITNAGTFGGSSVKVSPQFAGSQILVSTTGAVVNIDYVDNTPTATGIVKVTNAASKVAFVGGGTMTVAQDWELQACTDVSFSQPTNINSNLLADCPTTFNKVTTLTGALTVADTVTVKETFSANGASSNILLSDGTLTLDASSKTLQVNNFLQVASGKTGIININAGTLELKASTYSLPRITVNVNSGNWDIDSTNVNINQGKVNLASAGGTITGDNDSTLSFSQSASPNGLIITGTTSETLRSALSFSGSNMASDAPLIFPSGSGNVLFAGGSTFSFKGLDVQSGAGLLRFEASTATHSSGTFQISTDVEFAATTTFSRLTSTSTVQVNAEVRASGGSQLTTQTTNMGTSGKITLTGASSYSATSNSDVFGQVSATDSTATFSNADFGSSTRLIASGATGSVTVNAFTNNNGAQGTASNSGTISLGTGDFGGQINLSSLGVFATSGNSYGCKGTINTNNGRIRVASGTFQYLTGCSISPAGTSASSIITNTGATFTITGGNKLNLGPLLSITGSGTVLVNSFGELDVNDGSLSLTGGSLDVKGAISGDGGLISVTGGVVSFSNYEIFDDSTTLELGGSTFSHNGLKFIDDAQIKYSTGTAIINDSSSISMEGDSRFLVSNGATLTIDSAINFWSDSALEVSGNSNLYIADQLDFNWSSDFLISGFSDVYVYDQLDFFGSGKAQVNSSILYIKDADFNVYGPAGLGFFQNGDIDFAPGRKGQGGHARIKAGAYLEVDTTVDVVPKGKNDNGPIILESGSQVKYTGKFVYSSTQLGYYGPHCDVFTGNLNTLNFTDDSEMKIQDEGCVIIKDSALSVEDSQIYITDLGRLELDNGELYLTGDSLFDLQLHGSILLHSDSYALFGAASTANAQLQNMTHLIVDDSKLELNASLTLEGDTLAAIRNDALLEVKGDLELLQKSLLLVNASTVNVNAKLTMASNFLAANTSIINGFNTIISTNNANNNFTDGSILTLDGGDLTVEGSSFVRILTAASASVDIDSQVLVKSAGELVVDGAGSELVVNGEFSLVNGFVSITDSGSITVADQGKFFAQSNGTVNVNDASLSIGQLSFVYTNDTSKIELSNGGVFSIGSDGAIEIAGESRVEVLTASSLIMDSQGLIQLNGQGSLIADSSTVTLNSGSIVRGSGDSSIEVNNKATASLQGSLTVNDTASLTVNDATFDVQGLVKFEVDSDGFVTNSGNLNIIGNDLELYGTSELHLSDQGKVVLSNLGSLELYGESHVDLQSDSDLEILAQKLYCEGKGVIEINKSTLSIDGGKLQLTEDCNLEGTNEAILNILSNNLEMIGDSTFVFADLNSNVLVDGGNAYITENSTVSLSIDATLEVKDGQVRCSNEANINLDQRATLSVTTTLGSVLFEDTCEVVLLSSQFTSFGSNTFDDNTKVTLSASSYDVLGSTSRFNDYSNVILLDQSKFLVNGGDAYISDNTNVTINTQSVLEVAKGTLFQEDNSAVYSATGVVKVDGVLKQTTKAFIEITGGELEVSGKLESEDDTSITLQNNSPGKISSSGSADFYDNFKLNVIDSSFDLLGGNGKLTQNNDAALILERSDLNINGFYTLNGKSLLDSSISQITVSGGIMELTGTSTATLVETVFVVSKGGVLVQSTANFELDGKSAIQVTDGYFNITGNSVFSPASGSTIDVKDGEFSFRGFIKTILDDVEFTIGGDVLLTDSADVTFTDSIITVTTGTFLSEEDGKLSIDNSIVSIADGDISVNGSLLSQLTIGNSNITVDLGDFNVTGYTRPSFTNVVLNITNGDSNFSGEAASLWTTSSLFTDSGDIIFDTNADVTLVCSNITVTGGYVAFRDNVDVNFSCGNIVVTLGSILFSGSGNYIFDDGSVDLSIGSITFDSSANIDFDNTDITIQSGNLVLEDSVTGSFTDLQMLVKSGSVRIDNDVDISFTNAPLTVESGAINLLEDATIRMNGSPIVITAGSNGSFKTNDDALIELSNSPLSVFGGNLEMHDTSVLSILTSTSTVVVSGSLELFDSADIDTVPGASISISNGILSVKDQVDLDWTEIKITVDGTVTLDDESSVSLFSSSLTINDGLFSITGFNDFLANDTTIEITDGTLSLSRNSTSTLNGSTTTISGGSFVARNDSFSHWTESSLTIAADSNGSFDMFDTVHVLFSDSSITMDDGNVRLNDYSILEYNTPACTLTINEGDFDLYDHSQFITFPGNIITILGNFNVHDYVALNFAGVITTVAGNISLRDQTSFSLVQGAIMNINGGNFGIHDDVTFSLGASTINITDGSFIATGNVDFNSTNGVIFISGTNSDMLLYGSEFSEYTFNGSAINIVGGGNLETFEDVSPQFISTEVTIEGGFVRTHDNSDILLSDSNLSVIGSGTLTTYNNTHIVVTDQSSISVDSEGASVSFGQDSLIEFFEDSTFNVTDGSVSVENNSVLNLWQETQFNVLGGSFIIQDNSTLTAYPGTTGTIFGGSLFISDNGALTFIQSEIVILGAINSNSTVPVLFLGNTTILVNGGGVTVSGVGVIIVNSTTSMHVLDGNVSLLNSSCLIIDNSTLKVSGGSILVKNYSCIKLLNGSEGTVEGGNITTYDHASFLVDGRSTVLVTATSSTSGSVYITGSSTLDIKNQSNLFVIGGNLEISNHTVVTSVTGSTIRVVDGDLKILDYSQFYSKPNTLVEVLAGGNFLTSGPGVVATFSTSTTRVRGGDFSSEVRSIIRSTDSTFVISNNGNVRLTDLTRTYFNDNTELNILGGGSLYLYRESNLFVNTSSITVDNGGDVSLTEKSTMELVKNSSLSVVNGGSISFEVFSSLYVSNGSIMQVLGGGDITFVGSTSAFLQGGSSLAVFNAGSIVFSESSSVLIRTGSDLLVKDGGNIEFTENAYLTSTESSLTVLGGGSILFSGNTTNSVSQTSRFYVDGGNIEYNGDVILLFSASTFEILSGDLKSYERAVFIMKSESRGYITGGDFILDDSSNVTIIESSSLEISAGNVELYERGILNINSSRVLVTGEGSNTGYFKTTDNVVLNLSYGLIGVDGGDFQTSRSANVTSKDSNILVTAGSARFTGSTTFYGERSTVSVSGGDLKITQSTSWSMMEDSLASVVGGSLLLSGQSESILDHSAFQVVAGNCELSDSSSLAMYFSGLSVSGGDLVYRGTSVHRGEDSVYTVTGGQIIHDNSSQFSIVRSSVTVNRNSEAPRITAPISDNDLIVVGGSSSFSASQNSLIRVLRGNFIFVDNASSTVVDSVIELLGGDIKFDNRAVTTFTRTNTTIAAGGFTVSGSSSLSISDASAVNITGGSFTMNNSPTFRLSNSAMNIITGSARVNGGSFTVLTSSLALSGTGVLSFSGSSSVLITSSVVSLNNNSNLDISGSTGTSVVSSTFSIRSGRFTTSGTSTLNFLTSQFTISGGSTSFGGNSVVTITTSNFTVTGGNVAFAENSRVTIAADSTYSLVSGNVTTSGSSVLSITSSCFTLTSGGVTYGGSSRISLVDSCWIIKGGNAQFNGNTKYSLSASSLLRIEGGSFVASGRVNISVDDSEALIIGGDLIAQVSSTLSLTNSALMDVIDGNALFSGSTTATVTDSVFSVSGGYVQFEGSSVLSWTESSLHVSGGDLIVKGISTVSFSASTVLVSGGGIEFSGASDVSVVNTEVSVNIGSIKFGGDSNVVFRTSSVNILSGDMQFAEESNVSFYSTPIFVAGQMEFLGEVNTYFKSSDITILSGNMHFREQANAHFVACDIAIGGGMTAQNEADVLIEDSSITIEDGDLNLLDIGSFSVHGSTVSIISGNLIASNADKDRKYISFTDSQINIYDSNTRSVPAGNFIAHGNVELSLLQSDVYVDGNMVLTGTAKVNIQQSSTFNIPKGVVVMEALSKIELDESSALINNGQLFAPGELRAPGSASVVNGGRMESTHDFNSNCYADMGEARAPLFNGNSATFSLQGSVDRRLQSCIDNLQHSGYMSLGRSNVTFNAVDTDPESVITLDDSSLGISTGSPFASRGTLGGRGSFTGGFENRGTGVIMANGESGTTNLDIDGDFANSGAIFFMINSRDLSDPGALTQLRSTQRVAFSGGRACVCLNPLLELEIGDRWDLVTAGSALDGRFDEIELDCAECPRRYAKSIEGSESECEPVADYGTRSFSVLFESCDGGSGNYLEAITPPWYVIFPVSITIIIVLVVCFGGALFVEGVFRKRKFKRKMRSKRKDRVKKMLKSDVASNSSQSSDASL